MDVINLYPKTLCPCSICPNNEIVNKNDFKSSSGVLGCKIPKVFDCVDRIEISSTLQPRNEKGWYDLNPELYKSKIAEGFEKVTCPIGDCPQPTYISIDPRLRNQMTGDYLVLDRPPMEGDVRLKNVYDDKYTDYGQGFQSYDEIKDGQITYYVDRSIQDAFYHPVFSEPAKETTLMFRDPMSSMKPEYNRKAIINTSNPLTTTPTSYPYCLSFIQDSQSFREDIMALQQRKNNQSKWTARWTNNEY
jgi:hypothetical protein